MEDEEDEDILLEKDDNLFGWDDLLVRFDGLLGGLLVVDLRERGRFAINLERFFFSISGE
jgi:hypothetical protein